MPREFLELWGRPQAANLRICDLHCFLPRAASTNPHSTLHHIYLLPSLTPSSSVILYKYSSLSGSLSFFTLSISLPLRRLLRDTSIAGSSPDDTSSGGTDQRHPTSIASAYILRTHNQPHIRLSLISHSTPEPRDRPWIHRATYFNLTEVLSFKRISGFPSLLASKTTNQPGGLPFLQSLSKFEVPFSSSNL